MTSHEGSAKGQDLDQIFPMEAGVQKPDYRGLKRARTIGRHASGAPITEHALIFKDSETKLKDQED